MLKTEIPRSKQQREAETKLQGLKWMIKSAIVWAKVCNTNASKKSFKNCYCHKNVFFVFGSLPLALIRFCCCVLYCRHIETFSPDLNNQLYSQCVCYCEMQSSCFQFVTIWMQPLVTTNILFNKRYSCFHRNRWLTKYKK